MLVIRFLVYGVASFACAKVFFDSSLLAMSFIFCILNVFAVTPKEEYLKVKKVPKHIYVISIVACLVGLLLIILGKNFLHKDVLIIVGAFLFAPTISGMVIVQVFRLLGHLKERKPDSE